MASDLRNIPHEWLASRQEWRQVGLEKERMDTVSEAKPLKQLPIDWEKLELSVWFRTEDFDHPDLLDTQTGKVVHLHQDVIACVRRGDSERLSWMPDWQQEQIPLAEQFLADEGGRFLCVPQPDRAERHRAMLDFACLPEVGALRERLLEALDGRGAFRRFRQLLERNKRASERWHKYEQDWEREWLCDWLLHHGIDPGPARQPRSPAQRYAGP